MRKQFSYTLYVYAIGVVNLVGTYPKLLHFLVKIDIIISRLQKYHGMVVAKIDESDSVLYQ